MSMLQQYFLSKPSVVNALVLARRVFATWYVRDVADVIRARSSHPVVKALQQNPHCTEIDPVDILQSRHVALHNHFGYTPISKVNPLAFAWTNGGCEKQLILDKIPAERLSSFGTRRFTTPMVTLVDYVNENVNGHPGLLHGGMTTTIAHSAMSLVAALNVESGSRVVPRSLNMDYRKPIRTGSFIKIHSWLYGEKQSTQAMHTGDRCLQVAVHLYSMQDELLVEAISDISVSTQARPVNR
ncbi:hypothetical protein GGI07_001394 [Coemansia sp. Benny D115]|nr:hypothetical protein GGI07_001394 [Coemansia sp. Benny D115]